MSTFACSIAWVLKRTQALSAFQVLTVQEMRQNPNASQHALVYRLLTDKAMGAGGCDDK